MALTRATDKIIANADGNLNLSGIVTASSFVGNVTGAVVPSGDVNVGSNIKIGAASGIVTATSFSGDGSNLTSLPAGLGTALSSTQTSPLNKLYYTNEILSIGATVTVDHPATGTGAYTQYADIRLDEGADLIIEDGDDVIPDILGLGTDGGGLGAGGSGRIRVDSITNKNANGAPNFPNGLTGTAGTFTGAITAASATITGNLGVGGVLTYEDVTNIDSIGIVTARLGINLVGNDLNVGSNIKIGNASGIITATSFRGDASQMTGAGLGTDGSANTSGIITATAFIPTTGQLSHRNKVINGAMTISQRGTSFASTLSEGQYTMDRFMHSIRGTNDSYYYHVSDSPDGFNKSMKVTCNSTYTPSGSDNAGFITSLEGQDFQDLAFGTSSAKSITISFYAKSGSQNNGHQYSFQIRTHPSGGATNRIVTNSFTVTSSWQRFSFTFAGDTGADIRNDNAVGIQLLWWLDAGPTDIISQIPSFTSSGSYRSVTGQDHFLNNTSNEFYITGVQLEVGSVVTPFEHRSFGDELLRCMRYYEGVYMTDGTALMKSYASYGGGANFEYQFKVEKRTTPTFSLEGNASWSGATPNAYESRSACLFQDNGGTLFSLGDAHDDLCASFTAEL